MTDSPYHLPPSSFFVVNVSGGRTSAYMLRRILDAHDGALPDNAEVVFANTGMERPETLDFVARLTAEWSVPITWLEYRYRTEAKGGRGDPKAHYEIVSHNRASRDGEPFDALLERQVALPNPQKRYCSFELKAETVDRYMTRERGFSRRDYLHVIGFRADEPERVRRASGEDCRLVWPLYDAGVTTEDVAAFWRAQPFDLNIPSWKGNCTVCPMRKRAATVRILREEPHLADWWIAKEKRAAERGKGRLRNPLFAQFNKSHTVEQLRDEAVNSPLLPELEPDQSGVDCFCGD